jgi:hypothetical protein
MKGKEILENANNLIKFEVGFALSELQKCFYLVIIEMHVPVYYIRLWNYLLMQITSVSLRKS